jgi:Uma2 family endonuclease
MTNLARGWIARHALSVEDYHRMGEAGILHEEDRVELIEGEIIDMGPIGSLHAGTVAELTRALVLAVGAEAMVWTQNPLRLGGRSEPEPDIALLRPQSYRSSLPRAEDVLLIVEVAEASLRYDREIKVPLYARHGVPEVWLVDLAHRVVHAFSLPSQRRYEQVQALADLGRLPVPGVPGATIDLSFLLS